MKRARNLLKILAGVTLLASSLLTAGSLSASADAGGTGGLFVSVPYARIMNTSTGVGGSNTAFGSYETRSYAVLGVNGVPSTGVSAVLVDLAATAATADDTVATVWPSGTTRPDLGTLRYGAGTVPRSNTIAVAPGADGKISVRSGNGGTTDLNLDIQGYFTAVGPDSSVSPGGFVPLTPKRVLDTSTGVGGPATQIQPGSSRTVQVAGAGEIPAGATAVFANVSVSAINTDGRLMVGTSVAGAQQSSLPLINFSQGGPEDMGVSIPLSSTGSLVLFHDSTGSTGVQVSIDVQGYFSGTSSMGGGFTPVGQATLLDTTTTARIPAGGTKDFAVGGTNGLPTYGVGGAMLGIVASSYDNTGSLELYSSGAKATGLSNLNFKAGENGVAASTTSVVRPGSYGKITVINTSTGAVDVRVNLQGWFSAQRQIAAADETAFIADAVSLGTAEDIARLAVYLPGAAANIPTTATIADGEEGLPEPTASEYSSDGIVADMPFDPGAGETWVSEAASERSATNGVCATGYSLGEYGKTVSFSNAVNVVLFKTTMRKRWCYDYSGHVVGSHYWSLDTKFYNSASTAWNEADSIDPDQRYFTYKGYRKGQHFQTETEHLERCLVVNAFCDSVYYRYSITGNYDGSKNASYPG